MKKHYLIRRKLERFLGPMSLDEVQQGYQRMDFAGQDEICGHCSKWIALDDVVRMRQLYPEVLEVLSTRATGTWNMPGDESSVSLRPAPLKAANKVSAPRKGLWIPAIIAVAIAAVAGAFLANNHDVAQRFISDNIPVASKAAMLLEQQDYNGFATYMNRHLDAINTRLTKNRSGYNEWIPFIRAQAYLTDGFVPGVKPKFIQGAEKIPAPMDCSVSQWKLRWQEGQSEFDAFVAGTALSRRPWARIVLWDPHWIRRRSDVEGWIIPQNYFAYCLEMAAKAWEQLKNTPERGQPFVAHEAIERRIAAQINILADGTPINEIAAEGALKTLNCLDTASSPQDAASCAKSNMSNEWQELVTVRYGEANLRTQLARTTSNEDSQIQKLNDVLNVAVKFDPYTSFEYAAELRFAKLVLLNQGDQAAAAAKAKKEFPEVSFK